jgi:hypothetical protein
MVNTVSVAEKIVDVWREDKVQSIIASMENGPGYSNKVELVCQCLNKELSGYGFYSYPSLDHMSVLVNDK